MDFSNENQENPLDEADEQRMELEEDQSVISEDAENEEEEDLQKQNEGEGNEDDQNQNLDNDKEDFIPLPPEDLAF